MESILPVGSDCLFESVDAAVDACCRAQAEWSKAPKGARVQAYESMKRAAREFEEDLAWAAWSETGRGDFKDKVVKNHTVATKTPGPEELTPKIFTGTHGATMVDYAPFGVIGSITPTTNPTATVISNSLTILSGGNGVVFQPHPSAAACTCRAAAVMHDAVVAAGGPKHLIVAIRNPSIDGACQLMRHPKTAANLVTGGPAVVKKALESGKRSFCAGPGNPPVVVDETADLRAAAKSILAGASFDNNMICSDEKEVFAVSTIYSALIDEFKRAGAYVMTAEECQRMKELIFQDQNVATGQVAPVDHTLVGMPARDLLRKIGVDGIETKLAIALVKEDDPLVLSEQLLPVLPVAEVADYNRAVECAVVAEHNYRHSAALWTKDVQRITEMPHRVLTSNFVVNGPIYAGLAVGGEGYTSFSIAGATGEGYTRPSTFARERRFAFVDLLSMT